MPQIAYLLSPQGAMNQQREKPNVENSPIVDYTKNIKNTALSYNPIKTKTAESPSILNRLMGLFSFNDSKVRGKLVQILTVLEKMDESRERDYQIMYMNQQIKKEKDDLRHKEVVNLFVEATKRRKRNVTRARVKPMGGGLASSLLIAGGAIGLLTFSSDAIAGIKKSIDIDLTDSVKKEFDEELEKLKNIFSMGDFEKEYENIKDSFKDDLDSLSKIRDFFELNFSTFLGGDEPKTVSQPEKDFDTDAEKMLQNINSQISTIEEKISKFEKYELKEQQERKTASVVGTPETVLEPEKPVPVPVTKRAEAVPRVTRVEEPSKRETAQRAASLSIQRETSAKTKTEAVQKLGQVVDNDPSPGQKSYGIFGMNTTGGIISFVEQYGKKFGLDKFKPGSPEFDKKWKEVAQARSSEFFDAQLNWYQNNIVSPLEKELSTILPQQIANDPKALIYMADRRLQYGRVMEQKALSFASSAKSTEEFIRRMSEFDRSNVEKAFETYLESNPKNRQGLINRINERERQSLRPENINFLGILIDERSRENDFASIQDSYMSMPYVAVNNTNVVTQKRITMNNNPNIHAHPLVG